MAINFDDYKPHEYAELICLKCFKRWIGIYQETTLLKDLECPQCEKIGFVIKTGQTLILDDDNKDKECLSCEKYINNKCSLGLHPDNKYYCGYYSKKK